MQRNEKLSEEQINMKLKKVTEWKGKYYTKK